MSNIPLYHPDPFDSKALSWLEGTSKGGSTIQHLSLRYGSSAYLLNVEGMRCGYHPADLPNELKQVLKHAAENNYDWIIIGLI